MHQPKRRLPNSRGGRRRASEEAFLICCAGRLKEGTSASVVCQACRLWAEVFFFFFFFFPPSRSLLAASRMRRVSGSSIADWIKSSSALGAALADRLDRGDTCSPQISHTLLYHGTSNHPPSSASGNHWPWFPLRLSPGHPHPPSAPSCLIRPVVTTSRSSESRSPLKRFGCPLTRAGTPPSYFTLLIPPSDLFSLYNIPTPIRSPVSHPLPLSFVSTACCRDPVARPHSLCTNKGLIPRLDSAACHRCCWPPQRPPAHRVASLLRS
ncbi:hypothetical protein GQ53DRAFT_76077 [Thozetella sp. PMI_491]|nr:hypothetical protein GQ53DRAFT_76077 [Thozetella sp. PMI_491]